MLKINKPQYLLGLICRAAINHRFFSLKPPHEPIVVTDGAEKFHGSDILKHFGDEWGNTLFTTRALGTIRIHEIAVNLKLSGLGRADNTERARLLNNLEGIDPLMLEYFSDDELDIKEFSDWLRQYEAFRDPYGKKVHLIIKQGLQAGFWENVEGQREVPIDYHIMEMMVRFGMIEPNKYYIRRELMPTKDCFKMRKATRIALHKYIKEVEIDPYDLDDILWNASRTYCHNDKCDECTIKECTVKSVLNHVWEGSNGRVLWEGHWF